MSRRLATGSASDLDFAAMAAVSNIYRAANAVRYHMEQKVTCRS